MWRVSTTTGTILVDAYTNDVNFTMANVPGLTYNTTYVIGVKARVAGNWGPFGNYCSLVTETLDLPTTGIVAADCGTTIQTWGETIEAIALDEVLNYEWHITGSNYNWTAFTAEPVLSIVNAMQLTAGETYEVSVRCAYGSGVFTDWSSTCTFTVALELPVAETQATDFEFNLYPNPNNGTAITIEWEEAGMQNEILSLSVRDAAGKMVLQTMLNSNEATRFDVNFDNRLSSGFYVVTLETGTKRMDKKMIVQ